MASASGSGARALALIGTGLVVVSVAMAVVAQLASTARSALLFTDGDSMLPLLVMRSIDAGQPQDWAMSSVLFLPELVVFGLLWVLRLGTDATIVLAGIVNVVALFGALRVAAGSRVRSRMPVAGALVALFAYALLAVLDHTASRDSLELASLLVTTTYYSATVIAVIVSIGLVRRALEPVRASALPAILGVGAVAAASVLSNPIYLLWGTGPLLVVVVVVSAIVRRPAARGVAVALLVGSAIGYLARIPLRPFIANDGVGYIDVTAAGASVEYYLALLVDLWRSPAGVVSTLLGVGLLALAVISSVRLRGRAASVVAVAGWVLPVVVVVGAVVLGTHAARYLQPAVFAPVAALVVLPQAFPAQADALRRWFRSRGIRGAAVIAAVLAIVAGPVFAVPRLSAPRVDADLDCVTAWVDAAGRTGGGQFWTVRLPKTRIADPRALVQVDAALRPYEWLVNRADSDAGAVSFLVIDDASTGFTLPGADLSDASLVDCGRYTIADFAPRELPLGTPRS